MIEFTTSQVVMTGLLAAASSVLVALISFFGGRGSVQAQLQGQINESFKLFNTDLQEELSRERFVRKELESRVDGLEQHVRSLEELLRRQGIDVPPRRMVEPILMLDKTQHKGVA